MVWQLAFILLIVLVLSADLYGLRRTIDEHTEEIRKLRNSIRSMQERIEDIVSGNEEDGQAD